MTVHKRKTILITGGTGFIGSALILQLQHSYNIICLSRSTKNTVLKKNTNKSVTYVTGDLNDTKLLARIIKKTDMVIHCAGGGGDAACETDPLWAYDTYIRGTKQLIDCAKQYGISKFILASSYLVYGSQQKQQHKIRETNGCHPDSAYTTLKTIGEHLLETSTVPYVILRLANVYGYNSTQQIPNAGALYNFIQACVHKGHMNILGSGTHYIDYVHIQDVVDVVERVVSSKHANEIYNIGSGDPLTISSLAKKVQSIGSIFFKRVTPIKKIYNKKNVRTHTPIMNIQKAYTHFKWKPNVSLDAGIRELCEHHT